LVSRKWEAEDRVLVDLGQQRADVFGVEMAYLTLVASTSLARCIRLVKVMFWFLHCFSYDAHLFLSMSCSLLGFSLGIHVEL
jgi:hypothetical protein